MSDRLQAPDWYAALAKGTDSPMLTTFGGLDVWTVDTTFVRWPHTEPSHHELNCRKSKALTTDVDGEMSCAEIDAVRRFISHDWNAGWLATCGRSNPQWRRFMLAARRPGSGAKTEPLPLVPDRIAPVLAAGGRSGYPDVVAWRNELQPVFAELKGPGDTGTAQADWLRAALDAGRVSLNDFLLVRWSWP